MDASRIIAAALKHRVLFDHLVSDLRGRESDNRNDRKVRKWGAARPSRFCPGFAGQTNQNYQGATWLSFIA